MSEKREREKREGTEPDEARRLLADAGGVVRRAVEPGP